MIKICIIGIMLAGCAAKTVPETCSSVKEIFVHIDYSSPSWFYGSVTEAINNWNVVLNDCFILTDEETGIKIKPMSLYQRDFYSKKFTKNIIGLYVKPDVIFLYNKMKTTNRVVTIMHELGHALGLPHLEPPCVMQPVVQGITDLCPEEVIMAQDLLNKCFP